MKILKTLKINHHATDILDVGYHIFWRLASAAVMQLQLLLWRYISCNELQQSHQMEAARKHRTQSGGFFQMKAAICAALLFILERNVKSGIR